MSAISRSRVTAFFEVDAAFAGSKPKPRLTFVHIPPAAIPGKPQTGILNVLGEAAFTLHTHALSVVTWATRSKFGRMIILGLRHSPCAGESQGIGLHARKEQVLHGEEFYGGRWASLCGRYLISRVLSGLVNEQLQKVWDKTTNLLATMTSFPCHALAITVDYFNAAHLDVGDAGFAFFTYFRIGRKRARGAADVPPSGMPPYPETGNPPFLVLPGYKAFVELQSGSVIAILGSKVWHYSTAPPADASYRLVGVSMHSKLQTAGSAAAAVVAGGGGAAGVAAVLADREMVANIEDAAEFWRDAPPETLQKMMAL